MNDDIEKVVDWVRDYANYQHEVLNKVELLWKLERYEVMSTRKLRTKLDNELMKRWRELLPALRKLKGGKA